MKQPIHAPDQPLARRQKPYTGLAGLKGRSRRIAAHKAAQIMGDSDD
jgi:hypothetical protein